MRKVQISVGEYYHVFNRGVTKQTVFRTKEDYVRFLFGMLFYQSPKSVSHPSRYVQRFLKEGIFIGTDAEVSEIVVTQDIELVAFCLMPNHFHILLKEKQEGGVARYMHRLLNAYSKFYNTKFKKSGHVFQGPYKAVHIESNTQLLYVSAYIHRNCREMSRWTDVEETYPWSTYQDYVEDNRWGKLLEQNILLEQFDSSRGFKKFTTSSSAKLLI